MARPSRGRGAPAMNDSPPPVSGLVAGKYEVLRLIGRGGMGSVWEGRHASLGTRVAVKFIDHEYADSEEAKARFVTEARAAAAIESKHAIQIFDHGVTDDGRPYIVMELLVGEALDKRIERLGTLSLGETARILLHVCRALQRAHEAGVIHRDLKPENIFLVRSPDDDDEIAKVLDFGIAKIKGPPGGAALSSSTKTGAVLGTPYFMSPEQARGLRGIDHRTDLWSLGVIAYKCVTGVLPFDGESVGDLLVKICTGPLPTPSMTLPGLPATFDAWFTHALEREPVKRFGNATELADALALVAGVSTRRGAMSARGGAPPAPTTGPTSGASHGGGQATLAAGGVTSSPLTASAPPKPSPPGAIEKPATTSPVAMTAIGASSGPAVVPAAAPSAPPPMNSPATLQPAAPAIAAPAAPRSRGAAVRPDAGVAVKPARPSAAAADPGY